MPDISMCMNDACPSRATCYRHEATPNPWRQAYTAFQPDESGRCEDYIPLLNKPLGLSDCGSNER
jgi:hypothetical protein